MTYCQDKGWELDLSWEQKVGSVDLEVDLRSIDKNGFLTTKLDTVRISSGVLGLSFW